MRVTIDRAGRIVVPRQLRDRLGLVSGKELAFIRAERETRSRHVT